MLILQNLVEKNHASWLSDHHDNGTAYSVASYTKGELFLVELGYIMGRRNTIKSDEKILSRLAFETP